MTHEPEFNFWVSQIYIVPWVIENGINFNIEFAGNSIQRVIFLPLIINAVRWRDRQNLSGLEAVWVILQNIIVCP